MSGLKWKEGKRGATTCPACSLVKKGEKNIIMAIVCNKNIQSMIILIYNVEVKNHLVKIFRL